MAETATFDDGSGRDRQSARDDLLAPGSMIDDRYEVLDLLGQGGCAVVYRVYDHRLREELALKRLRSDRITSDQSMRLRREVRYAREIHSEHLVRIYDVSGDEDHPYITMELVEGETLAERLRRDGRLSIDETLRIAEEILLALQALHEHEIVHRDVKPGNILLTPEGKVRLADLGLARNMLGVESAMTSPGSMVGTWEYISPEQAIGSRIIPESDLYSFGIVLFEMLTGKLPFDCDSSVGFLSAHLTQRPRSLRKGPQKTPRWLDRLVSRLLEKRATDRYRSAADVRADISARHATPAPRRIRMAVGVAFLVLLIVSTTAGYLWWASRFAELVETTPRSVTALDRQGRILWTRDDLMLPTTTPFRVDGRTRIAAMDRFTRDATQDERMRLSVLDPQTGRRLDTVLLPSGAGAFPDMPDQFFPNSVRAIDTDHDGNEELSITYHHDYWPSFAVAWDPLSGDRAVTFLSSGHHRLVGTADLDGDGMDELLYIGVNNRMGWYRALAAVSPGTESTLFSPQVHSMSPDQVRAWSRSGLIWYALLPRDVHWFPPPEIDHEQNRIMVPRIDGSPIEIMVSGFARSWSSDLASAERNAARRAAYQRLREAGGFLAVRAHDEAVKALSAAVDLADSAGDPVLRLWAETLRVRALIGSGELDAADALVSRLVAAEYATPSDIHWEAATACHLQGHLRRAVGHYRTGMARIAADASGRFAREFAVGAVLALRELGEIEEANELVDAFERAATGRGAGPDLMHLRNYIRWSSGSTPESLAEGPALVNYEYRYWNTEYRRQTAGSAELLEDVRSLLGSTSGMTPMLLSLEADLLHELGRFDEAAAVSTRAVEAMRSEIGHNIFVRAHRKLIESRHQTITQ